MARIEPVSQTKLSQRRRTLVSNRRLKMFQAFSRTLAISGIAGGLLWAATQPIWVLRESNQIVIEGNYLLSKQVINSLLPLSYPQSLWQIQPEAIARSLESQPTIADVTVTRQLFPPGLRVQVKERIPVALAIATPSVDSSTSSPKASIGLLDQTGVWIPIQSYASQSSNLKLPKLKVIGLPEQYRPYWAQLYQAVSRSPVKVTEINSQDPANIILKTELGLVHLGPYSPHLPAQIKVLDQMRQLPAKVNPSQIAYIDLKNIEAPLVQMNQLKEIVKIEPQ